MTIKVSGIDIAKINFPLHGTDDVGIPLAGVKRLYELAGEPKDLVVVEGADHNLSDPRTYEITMNTVVEWFVKQWKSESAAG